jgi:hypothetical protein
MKENVLMSTKGPSAGNVLLKYLPIFVFKSVLSRIYIQTGNNTSFKQTEEKVESVLVIAHFPLPILIPLNAPVLSSII